MSTYRLFFNSGASLSVEVEADDLDAAIDAGYDHLPSGVCAQCSGWGQTWELDLGDDWVVDESHELDGVWVDGKTS